MGRQFAGVVRERSAGQRDLNPQPVGRRDKLRYGPLGGGRVEKPSHIGARWNGPTRCAIDCACAPYPEEAVTASETRLITALAKRIAAFPVKDRSEEHTSELQSP